MDRAARDDQELGRIAALLVALSVLALRAGGRSFPVRWFVLALLFRAEAATRRFLAEAFPAHPPCLEAPPEIGYGPADAALLALRFRALAAALVALCSPVGHSVPRPARLGPATRGPAEASGRLPLASGRGTLQPNDSS